MPPPATQSLTQLHLPHLPHQSHHQHHAAPPESDPVQLAHFVIFNPTLIPPKQRKRNKVDEHASESNTSTTGTTSKSSDHDQTSQPPSQPSSDRPDAQQPVHVTAPQAAKTGEAVAGADEGGKSAAEILESANNSPNPEVGTDVATKAPEHDDNSRQQGQSPPPKESGEQPAPEKSKEQSEAVKEGATAASLPARRGSKEEDNPDLEDDLREAAQILFYTSRQAGRVSRDMMLRQVGLAKGLMGFTGMAAPSSEGQQNVWAVHGAHSRMIVYAPLPNWYMYMCIKSADSGVHALSDQVLVAGLERGYHDFCLTHGPFDTHEPGHAFVSQLERFFSRWTLAFEATYLSSPSILTWLGGQPPSDPTLREKLEALPPPPGSTVGLITRSRDAPAVGATAGMGSAVLRASAGTQLGPHVTDALVRYLAPLVPPPPAPEKDKKAERQALGFGFRRKKSEDLRHEAWNPLGWVGLGGSRSASATPPPKPKPSPAPTHKTTQSGSGRRWFGDLGGVFGLGSKPSSPVPDAIECDKDTVSKAEGEPSKAGDSKGSEAPKPAPETVKDDYVSKKSDEDKVGAEDEDDKTSEGDKKDALEPTSTSASIDDTTPKESLASLPQPIAAPEEPGPMLAVSMSDSIVTSAASLASGASTPSMSMSTASMSTLGAHAPATVATDLTDVAGIIDEPIQSESTTLVDDSASVHTTRTTHSTRSTRSTPSLIAPEGRPPSVAILDALSSEPDPWVQRTVYVPQKARLRWVVRNGAMVFVVEPEAEQKGQTATEAEGTATAGSESADVTRAKDAESATTEETVTGETKLPETATVELEQSSASIAESTTSTETPPSESEEDKPDIDPIALKAVFTALDTLTSATPTAVATPSPTMPVEASLGIFHTPGLTKVRPPSGTADQADLVALANLREIGGLSSFGQLPSGRFVSRKVEEEGGPELFVLTQAQRTGITEAERAMRQWSYECEGI